MSSDLALLLFVAISAITYIGYIVKKYGVQSSISASYNNLETSVKKSLYSWFIAFVAIPTMIVSNNWMGVVAGMFLAIDFAAPTGGGKLQSFLHSLGANVGMLLGILMLGFMFNQWWLVGITSLVCLYMVPKHLNIHFKSKWLSWLNKLNWVNKFKVQHSTWWIEVAVLIAVWAGLFIEKILK